MDLPQTLTLRNGDKVTGTFSRAEMHRRADRLRAAMAERCIDAVLLTSYHNINY